MESFYRGKNVFITGGTGFIGKVVIEKLVRSVPSIGKIYVLIRNKKGSTSTMRLENEIIQSAIFDRLRAERNDFNQYIRSKLQAVSGDVCVSDLNLIPKERQLVETSVHIIIHLAATVSFDEPLDTAVEMNCLGALNVLRIAHTCQQLKSYVHVSTAYVNSNQKNCVVKEQLYPLDFNIEEAVQNVGTATPPELEKLHLNLIGTYPNTYTLTKSMAEHLLVKRRGNIPMVIYRPTIVGASWREPVPGWVDNVSAAGAIFLAIGMGLLTILPGNPRSVADIIPVDMVAASILLSAFDIAEKNDVRICHSGTSDPRENPMRWRIPSAVTADYWKKHPPRRGIFPPKFAMLQSHQNFQIQWFLRYALPSSVYSTVANATNDKDQMKQAAKLWAVTWRARMLVELFKPFTENEWIFQTGNLNRIRQKLSEYDRQLFNICTSEIVWERYLQNFCYGLNKYVMHDDLIDVSDESVKHTKLALNTGRILEWDRDHHAISFPGLFSDISWAYTSSRKPGYTKSGLLGRVMGMTGWKEGTNHEASHVPRAIVTTRSDSIQAVLGSAQVRQAIEAEVASSGRSEIEVESQAEKILNRMSASIDYSVIRKFAWILRKIWRQMYEEIKVDEAGLEIVRELARNGEGPLILIPTHRSYVDFLLMSYLFFAYNIPVPYIAAGEDFLNIKGFTEALRHSGAYFIRRSFKQDALYTALFTAYTHHLLSNGNTVEFFIEGTRSRSGKQLYPKLGMLATVVSAFEQKKITQAHIIPITMDYEKPLEVLLHQRELIGEGKVRESLLALLKSSHVLKKDFGCISVRFGTPIHLKEYMNDYASNQKPREKLVETLALDITDAMTHSAACMPSHLVSAILLMYRHGISKQQLVLLTDWLRQEVIHRGGQVLCTEGASRTYIVDRALRLLGPLVIRRRKDLIEPAIAEREQYENMIGLGYYRNKLLHLFDREGIVACAFHAIKKPFSLAKLKEEAAFLLTLLQLEFVRSCKGMDSIETTVQTMMDRSIFTTGADDQLFVSTTGETLYSCLCAMIWPFIDSYWVAVMSLFALLPEKQLEPTDLVKRMMWLAETMYHDKIIAHYESCSMETLRNALFMLEDTWNVIKTDTKPRGRKGSAEVQVITLQPKYQTEEALQTLAARIAQFRKLPISAHDTTHMNQLFAQFPALAKL